MNTPLLTMWMGKICELQPPGQSVICLTMVRDGVIIVTDRAIYQGRPRDEDYEIRLLTYHDIY